MTKFGATCSFDSDFNVCLPQRVAALRHVVVERVAAGGGHTILLGRRVQRRFGRGPGGRVAHVVGEGEGDGMLVDAEGGGHAGPAPPSEALSRDVGALSLGGGRGGRGSGSVDESNEGSTSSSSNGGTSSSSNG